MRDRTADRTAGRTTGQITEALAIVGTRVTLKWAMTTEVGGVNMTRTLLKWI
jgi:hypothetical protein